jgi:ABC-type multidrug transport system fused ATPase/permease subunit
MGIPAVFTRRRLRLYILLVANGLAQAGIAFATTLLMRVAFDRMLSLGATRAPDLWIALGFVAVAVTHMALRSRSRVDAERIGQDYVYAIRMAMYDKLASLGPRTLQKRSRGTLMLRFIGDLNSVRRWVSLG